jgi:hypothetical protein
VALFLVPRSEARPIAMRPSSRDGLRALAAAWRATQAPGERPLVRVGPRADAPSPDGGNEPPYWPDGPSAA